MAVRKKIKKKKEKSSLGSQKKKIKEIQTKLSKAAQNNIPFGFHENHKKKNTNIYA